jgi:thioredoxin reductase
VSVISYDLLIVGAGPAGIALAVEAKIAGVETTRTLVLEKAEAHSWTIRQFYPERRMTIVNYKVLHSARRRPALLHGQDQVGNARLL